MMKKIDVAILGAGIAGLGAALKCREQGKEYLVFEANNSAGGLLDNFSIDGFRFDNAVHLSFATEPKVREIFDKTPYFTHPADSLNFEQNKWLKHPVQNNLYPLEAEEKVVLIQSFLSRPEQLLEDDYESWLRHQYGDAIAERYPLKYTEKYWQCEAKELSTTWIGNRMRRAELPEILHGSYTSDTPNTYYTKEMRYPKKGGYKAFIQPLIDETTIAYGHKVVKIDSMNNELTFIDGQKVIYRQLVSSLPLPILIGLCGEDAPPDVKSSAAQLEATSIDLISVGFNKPIIKDLWFYIYDEDILASRAYSPSVKSPDNVPRDCSSLQFEIYNSQRCSAHSPDQLKENVLYALKKMNIASEVDILFLHHKHLPWANVTFKQGMETHRGLVRAFCRGAEIETVGRFGEWDYLWSNQSFLSGYNSL